jgi:methionyl-tRNA formyltransferase
MGNRASMKPFRYVIITQEDPFYVRVFFEEFLSRYAPRDEIQAVVIAPTMGKRSLWKVAKQFYEFYGPVDFIRMGFRFVRHKLGDLSARAGVSKRFYSIAQVCRHYGVRVMRCDKVNDEAFLDHLRALDLDLVVSVAAPQIFKDKLIALPRQGCINIHNSTLPKYRGMLPNFWQMFNGEKAVGTTIHRINAGIDDGEILIQRETPIQPGESLDSIITRTKRFGAQLMVEAIAGIKAHTLVPLPNPSELSTYYKFPTRKDVVEFRRRGHTLL